LVAVADDLVYGVCVVDLFFGLGLALDKDKGDAIDEEDYVGADVLVAVEDVLVGACEGVVLGVVIVDEYYSLAFFSRSKTNGALILQPIKKFLISSDARWKI